MRGVAHLKFWDPKIDGRRVVEEKYKSCALTIGTSVRNMLCRTNNTRCKFSGKSLLWNLRYCGENIIFFK
jgi:hypothetical protein